MLIKTEKRRYADMRRQEIETVSQTEAMNGSTYHFPNVSDGERESLTPMAAAIDAHPPPSSASPQLNGMYYMLLRKKKVKVEREKCH